MEGPLSSTKVCANRQRQWGPAQSDDPTTGEAGHGTAEQSRADDVDGASKQASKQCNALETSHAWPSPARDTSGAAWAGVQNWMERASTAAAAAASSIRLPSCRGTPLGTPNGGSHALNGRCAAQ